MLPPVWARAYIGRILTCPTNLRTSQSCRDRLLNWRILLALFFAATLALAPAIAEARAGSSAGGRSSSMGSRGSRTFENNGAQPLSRSVTPPPAAVAPARLCPGRARPCLGGGSFFQRHPFLTGLAGGFIGSWLFGHSGWAAGERGRVVGLDARHAVAALDHRAADLFRGAAVPRAGVMPMAGAAAGWRLAAALGGRRRAAGAARGATAGATSI